MISYIEIISYIESKNKSKNKVQNIIFIDNNQLITNN